VDKDKGKILDNSVSFLVDTVGDQALAGASKSRAANAEQRVIARKQGLVDMFARSITYLRVSLTDHCNLRCIYCTPKGNDTKLAPGELLSYEELLRVIGIAVDMGIRKVRLTGGEPLVRRDILSFIKGLAAIPELDDIRLTTNGVFLGSLAEDLYCAGIRKLNISLDTMQRERFREITGADCFAQVWDSIEKVEQLGFSPIKINMVVMRGINDDELLDFGRLSIERNYQVRFIEFMPIGKGTAWERGKYLPTGEMQERLASLGRLLPQEAGRKEGPARIYRIEGAKGSLGFISPLSNHFCDRCNRLRLTSEGRLRSCLLNDWEMDIKKVLREGGSDRQVREALTAAVLNKPKGHALGNNGGQPSDCHGRMSRIGG